MKLLIVLWTLPLGMRFSLARGEHPLPFKYKGLLLRMYLRSGTFAVDAHRPTEISKATKIGYMNEVPTIK